MKILFIADVHLGAYQEFDVDGSRLHRCFQALDQIIDAAYDANVDYIIDLGDLIDKKNLIDFRVYNPIIEYFSDRLPLDNGCQWVSLVGNHNIASKAGRDTNLTPLGDYLGVISAPAIITTEDVELVFIPYQHFIETWWTIFNDLSTRLVGSTKRKLLLAHQEIRGAVTGTHRYVASEGLEPNHLPGVFDWAVFGHYHAHQWINQKTMYLGALLQQEFGEVGNPQAFYIYDSDTNEWEARTLRISEFRLAESQHEIPSDTKDYWRLRTAEQIPPELKRTNIRVESVPDVVVRDRIQLVNTGFDESVEAYIRERIPGEKHEAVRTILRHVGNKR